MTTLVSTPYRPALLPEGTIYYDPVSNKYYVVSLSNNFDLMKILGDALSGIKDWVVKNLVPFFIGLMAIVVGIILFTKFANIF